MSGERVEGYVVVHTRGFGFLQLDGEVDGVRSAFIAPPDLTPLLAGDRVSAELTRGKEQRFRARNLTIESRGRDRLFGEVLRHRGRPFLKVDPMVGNTDWPLPGDNAPPDGTLVSARIEEGRLVDPREVPLADAGLERVVARYGIRTEFTSEVLETPTALSTAEGAGRRDLTGLTTVTIDGPTSRDLDDALSVHPAGQDGAIRVLVSIADVSALVRRGSPVDQEAYRRGTSVYLAGRVLPMLPPSLSEDALSLLPDRERPAMTAELRIDPEGEVTAVDLYRSRIRSSRRLSYEEVARFFDGRRTDLPRAVRECLRWLRAAAARLSAVRQSRGGVQLLREEASVRFDEDTGEPAAFVARRDTAAHALVERLMVATNEGVARWLVDRGLPGVFRVHPEPTPSQGERLAESARHLGFETGLADRLTPRGLAALEVQLAGSASGPSMDTVLRDALGPARYTVHPGLHFGLAAPTYLHFTSPIRRYADLEVHRIVKAYLRGERAMVAGDPAVEALAEHLNERAFLATKAERDRLRMLAARHFAGRVGERLEGDIVAVKPFGLIVQLRGMGITGSVQAERLPGGPYEVGPAQHRLVGEERAFTVGEPLEVEVRSADDTLGRIDLAPVLEDEPP
ncbi:MAG: ribonuclease R family protein [Sandaracinaceae bacterium]